MLTPIYGQTWGYRQRARLSVRHVLKKNRTLVGFREKNGKYVADMQHCEILTPKIASLLPLLGELNEGFTARDILPQIEVAVGDHVDVLVLRILDALTPSDEALIKQFADTHQVQFWTQTKGPETVVPFYPLDAPALSYSLPEFGIIMPFAPTEFTQVNSDMNRLMVSRAMRLLDPQPNERIADFFCGLGNFTLPIARNSARVLGVEGSDALVKRAKQNAEYNGLSANTTFQTMNLFEMNEDGLKKLGSSFAGSEDSAVENLLPADHSRNRLATRVTCHDLRFDKWLVDPPRDGAIELMKSISDETAPYRIVYVSCSPSTLARDAEVLVHAKGYTLKAAGVMNMFPQTSHVESIAVFERR
jgi:23S rRNA (uracil1939-C5)-methyltransferase